MEALGCFCFHVAKMHDFIFERIWDCAKGLGCHWAAIVYVMLWVSVLLNLAVLIFPQWKWLRLFVSTPSLLTIRAYRWWRRAQIRWSEEQRKLRLMPESVREGSPLITVKTPAFVVGIYGLRGDTKVLLGTGWRYGDYVVTAAHVVFEKHYKTLFIHNIKKDVFFEVKKWTHVAGDIATTKYCPQWELTSPKIDVVSKSAFATVYSARAHQNGSVGILKHIPSTALGFLEYSGSTLPGFSGSPYYNGNRVLGMHAGGGSVGNYGFSASYIDMILKSHKRPESSELEMVRRTLASARLSDFDYEQGLDETRVRIGGRYIVLDNAEFHELFEDQTFERYFYDIDQTDVGKQKRKKKQTVWEEPDYEPEAADEEEPDFHEPRSDSGLRVEDQLIELRNMHTSLMQSLNSIQEQALSGQKAERQNLESLFASMLKKEMQSCRDTFSQQFQTLSTSLQTKQQQMQSDLDDRLKSMKVDLASTSISCSEPLIPKVQQDLEPSAPSLPLETCWDGMDSDLQKFKQWRSSVDVSKPDYVASRKVFLETGLSLSTAQAAQLIARFKNQKKRQALRRPRSKSPKQRATQ